MFKVGDLIKVILENETIEGVYVPSPDRNILTLKLNSGYNLSIEKNKIKGIKRLGRIKKKIKKEKFKMDKKLPLISILHTGGTLASKVSYETGAVFASFTPEDILGLAPELKKLSNFHSRLVSNMWSDDLRFKHFSILANEIKKEIKKDVKGVIIGMGTDNLAVASAALSFIIEETPVPIILVGAQRSSDRGSSDAAMNLVCAVKFILNSDFAGVAICIHNSMSDEYCSILPACKTKKLHSSRRDAFKVVNDDIIAQVSFKTNEIKFKKKHYYKENKFVIKPNMEEKVGLIKVHINMFASEFKSFKGYRGLVIEGTGLGHTPLDVIDKYTKEHAKIKNVLQDLIKSGTIVVMTTGCLFGAVNMNVYSKGVDLMNLGVIPGENMLAETALVKLSWLLANYKKEEVKYLIRKNLRGEINERITSNFSI